MADPEVVKQLKLLRRFRPQFLNFEVESQLHVIADRIEQLAGREDSDVDWLRSISGPVLFTSCACDRLREIADRIEAIVDPETALKKLQRPRSS